MADLSLLAPNLSKHPDGYWHAGTDHRVSYPSNGHALCYSVEEGSFWFRHRNAVIVAAVSRFPPMGTVFDVGGGNGHVALALQNAGLPVVLVEPGPVGARHAVERGLADVVCSTVEGSGFPPHSLPAVSLFDVLEHIEDDVTFLSSLHAVMKPGGRLYVTVPAYQALWSLEDQYVGHYRRYSTTSLTHCLERAGFEIEYATYFFWFLPLPVLLFRTIPSRMGVRHAPSAALTHREHIGDGGLAASVVRRILAGELDRVRGARAMPFGGSCLAVARA